MGKQRPPLSTALLFAPVFVAVYLLHWTLLRLPYYWDEGSYYIPAAWDFFRLGTLIPETTMRNAHPPLPSILLAGWWKLTGFHVYSTRLLMCLVTTAALLAVFQLTRRFLDEYAALAVLVLTGIYPVWFAQSTLAHADMFAAVFTLWAVVFYADRESWTGKPAAVAVPNAISAALLFSLAALAKETAIVVPAALFLLEAWLLLAGLRHYPGSALGDSASPKKEDPSTPLRFTQEDESIPTDGKEDVPLPPGAAWRNSSVWLAAMAFPALPLLGWYLYHRAATGFMFGNPEFLRYNATANLSGMRVLLSLWHRMTHLTVHMNLFVPVMATCVLLFVPERKDAVATHRHNLRPGAARLLLVLLIAQWIAFSVLGGALLTRYLLPAYPMLLILCVAVWQSRTRWWPAVAGVTLLAFAVGCEIAPPYPFTPEDNLAYRDMIVVQQHAIHQLLQRYPGATVLTAWPVAADLQRPELGYVRTPVRTVSIENFASDEVAKAAANPSAFDVALVFSTKFDPPPGGLNLTGANRANDKRFYDYHRDLLPGEIARALGGSVVWQEDRKGEWAALLSFPRGYDARLAKPTLTLGGRSRRL
ncbi:MAG: ArnT family glycosyltransferase [Janthinobacterium lividum]